MAIDKTKVAQQAQKLIQKGQFDKAIKEYQSLVKADPKDIRSLLKIAELYGKIGKKDESVETFTKVAEQYNKSGFYTKAVAVLRQAIDADKQQIALYKQLADLYQKLGLIKDAIIQLNTAARLYQDGGRHDLALECLEKMREFDPEDPSVLARYGEALFNAGEKDKAVGIFRSLISTLKASNSYDDLIRFCERILTMNPDDIDALKDLSEAYVKVGLANKALLKLKALFDRNVLDADLYDLLDRAYQLLGKKDKAVHAQVEKAKYLLSTGNADAARRTYEQVIERDPGNADAIGYLRPSRGSSAKAVSRPSAAAPVSNPSAPPQGDSESRQLSKFLTEADVYLKYGLRDKAIEQLENVLNHDGNNISARKKLVDIYSEDDPTKAAAHLRSLAEISESLGEVQQAQEYLQRADELDPEDDESEAPPAAAQAADSSVGENSDSGFLDEDEVFSDDDDVLLEDDVELDVGGVEAELHGELLSDDSGSASLDDADFLDADIVGDDAVDESSPEVGEQLDEAEFYIQQGILGEAKAIYDRVLADHPTHAVAKERHAWVVEQMAGEAAKPAKAVKAPPAAPVVAETPVDEGEPLFDLAAELEEELDFGDEAEAGPESDEPPSFEDIFSQFKKGVERELKDDASAHYDLGIAYKEMGLVKDAIGEFEIALQDDTRYVESCNMTAICYTELGEHEKATDFYKKGLEHPECNADASLNMNYELALLYETLNQVKNAVAYYKKVIEQDKGYRDVAERIRALKAKVQAGKAYA